MIKLIDENIPEFNLVGVQASTGEDYKFVYELNKYLRIQLVRTQDLKCVLGKELMTYSVYEYVEEETQTEWFCIPNNPHYNKGVEETDFLSLTDLFPTQRRLIPEHKFYNYILKITGLEISNSFLASINSLKSVNRVALIDKEKIKNKQHLIF